MQKQAYPYCPHGAYVGGCGIDYMCHYCEMGDEPSTIAECRSYIAAIQARAVARIQGYIALDDSPEAKKVFARFVWNEEQPRIDSERREIAEILRWTDDENDRGWLSKRHEHNIAEWDRQNGDDQFWSLPEYVLDGA